ncbi:MAG: c-type cytochrome, partial [Burkholderiales bacterium]
MKLLAAFTVIALAAAGSIYLGIYDISATDQHLAPTYRLLDTAMRRSVRSRAADIAVPDLRQPGRLERGLGFYRQHCVQCHGAPGVAPEPFALGLTPAPANLAHTAREWRAAEIFWVVKEGIKMTGMPAWKYRMADDDIWAVVAFLQEMPRLSPEEYRSRKASQQAASQPPVISMPEAERGRRAIDQYACVTCHAIPGIVGSNAPVGPPLAAIATRGFIAGVLPNTPQNMVRWLRHPQAVNPRSAMPDLG